MTFTLEFDSLHADAFPEFETLVVSVGAVTLRPADGGEGARLDAGGATADLSKLDEEDATVDPVLDGAAVPVGNYERLVPEVAVESATLNGGTSANVDAGDLSVYLAHEGEPFHFTSNLHLGLAVLVDYYGENPWTVHSEGWAIRSWSEEE